MSWSTQVIAPYPAHLDIEASLNKSPGLIARITRRSSGIVDDERTLYSPRCYIKRGIYQENDIDYFLDPASIFPVVALDVQPGSRTLDLCAAPGGKSLLIASRALRPEGKLGEEMLVANEASPTRFGRLINNLRNFFPEYFAAGRILCTQADILKRPGVVAKHGPYDRILIDAPCSSDRHRYKVDPTMSDWSSKSVSRMAHLQKDLLSKAVKELTRSGGRIVYSTCALSSKENDEVVAFAHRKLGLQPAINREEFEEFLRTEIPLKLIFLNLDEPSMEVDKVEDDMTLIIRRTAEGYMILPGDLYHLGPIYFSIPMTL